MADSLSLPVLSLFKRVAKHFNRKFAEIVFILLKNKIAGAFGALAGFAIAIFFTRKFFGSPRGTQKRQRKETDSTSNSKVSFAENEVASCHEHSQLIDNEKEVLALGQVVKRRLCGSRKMTCRLLGVILEETRPEELQKHVTVRSSVVEVLLELSKLCDIYLMEVILDDESEERIISALETAGLFKTGGLIKDKILFCSTELGRLSFIRQLEPDWHVDTSEDVVSQLSRFVRYQLHISPTTSSFAAVSTIFSSTSLELYFAGEGIP